MCGVIGLRCETDSRDFGARASRLLRMLEYRGYDSTGAAVQASDGTITLRKDVGSPTEVCRRLDVPGLAGSVFCGQVRWATFGKVDRANAQPHQVACKTHLYGAHNGNITNCGRLKERLRREGHRVLSDNDGEMLVHVVEHHFAKGLGRGLDRGRAFQEAVLKTARELVGSYAAVLVDPGTRTLAAIKAGSSLYMGLGHSRDGGSFIIASSDLSSVLSQTKVLFPIGEDEFALFTHDKAVFHHLRTGKELERAPFRSRLSFQEAALKEPFKHFMEQEIFDQPAAVRKVNALFLGRSPLLDLALGFRRRRPAQARALLRSLRALSGIADDLELQEGLRRLAQSPAFRELAEYARAHEIAPPPDGAGPAGTGPVSALGSFLEDLAPRISRARRPALRLLDGLALGEEVRDMARRQESFARLLRRCRARRGRVTLLACGTSYHAAKVASVFFDKIAGFRTGAMLPGDFRAEASSSVRDGDLLITVSQSGETKDLIDIVNLVRASGRKAAVVAVVNNINSTLALEKADLCIPLFCGPETAVPATKSFMNQLAVFYALALETARGTAPGRETSRRRENLLRVPDLLEETLARSRSAVEKAARELYLRPSMHILATGMQGVAREGALKIREVVLNHTEGCEGAEFKHGPNTILGVNTVFGLEALRRALRRGPRRSLAREFARLYVNYPLLFVTGPAERDVNLTVSQINTHKIRGADIWVFAEEDKALREAIADGGSRRGRFRSGFIRLPRTGDDLLPFFTAAAALQLLALRMSLLKRSALDRAGIRDHGVHPDAPKNVSKSITVD